MQKNQCKVSSIRLIGILLLFSFLLSVIPVFALPNRQAAWLQPETESDETVPEAQSGEVPISEIEISENDVLTPQETISSPTVLSVPVITNADHTNIMPASGVDIAVNGTELLRVQTSLSTAESVSFTVDKPNVLSLGNASSMMYGEVYMPVTANQVGVATVTATVNCTNDNDNETVTIELYVTLTDGIYLIKSCETHLPSSDEGYGDYYLRVGEPSANPPVIHGSTHTYGDMTENIYRHWKIEYAGSGKYYIRPLMDTALALCTAGEKDVTVTDEITEKWELCVRNGEYEIISSLSPQSGLGVVLSSSSAQTGEYLPSQDYRYVIPKLVAIQNMAFERWELIEADVAGIYFRENANRDVKETFIGEIAMGSAGASLTDMGYSLVAFGLKNELRWFSYNSAVAQIDAVTGVITPKSCGTALINVYSLDNTLSVFFTVKVTWAGTYVLNNLQTGLYADIQNGSMTNGNEIEQRSFDGENTQKWVFTHVGNDVYTIRSAKDKAYYLGIQNNSTTAGANIVLRSGTVTDGMKWRIVEGNKGYKIVSYNNSSLVLSTYSTAATEGQKLVLNTYTNNTDYKDEWEIFLCKYSYNIQHYYDQGYDARFTDAVEDIIEYQRICSNVLLEVFGIEVTSEIQSYTSCADLCTGVPATLSDTVVSCNHSDIDHKTRSNIRSDLISQFGYGNTTLTRVAWTGHVLESRSSNSSSSSHTVVVSIGMVTDEDTNENLPDHEIRYQRIYTLLHELSHQLGAPDHYCYDMDSNNCNNPTNDCYRCDHKLTTRPPCLMYKRTYDIEDRLNNGTIDTLYCSQCLSAIHEKGIFTHLNDHH